MKTIYTVYQLNEKRNKLGNPYIGMTEDMGRRAKQWKTKLKLDYIPELIILHRDTNELRTWEWEQNRRVENGWIRERSLRHQKKMRKKANLILQKKEHQTHAGKIGGKIGGKICGRLAVESGNLAKAAILGGMATGKKNITKNRICKYCCKEGKYLSIISHERYCKFKPQL